MAQLIPVQRQRKILDFILAEETVQVSDLARRLSVSELTIRRDLEQLASKGLVIRSFGGASMVRTLSREPDYRTKASQFAGEKRAIGLKAAGLIDDGDTIFINSGSTTYEVIKAILESDRKVTIVTNNLSICPLLSSEMKATVIFTGGVYRSMSHSVSGALSMPVLDEIYANKAFIGVDGFSPEQGLTTPIQEEALTTKRMIEHTSGKVYAVFTASKIGVVSNFKTVDASKINCLITDEAGRRLLGSLAELEIEAIFA